MKFVTWNIRCQNNGDDARGCGWAMRLPQVVAVLRDLNPDIFAVQEAYATQMDDLRAAFPSYQSAGVGREDGKNDGEHCGIFFRREQFRLREEQTHWLSETPDVPSRSWDAACTRIVSHVFLYDRETEHEIKVWNAHLDHMSERARLESARLLWSLMSGRNNRPSLLCGDFNCAPDSAPIIEVTEHLRDARHHATRVEGEIATFCGFDEPLNGEQNRIDYVFADRFWDIESYFVPNDKQNWPPASDHRPVVVELKLK